MGIDIVFRIAGIGILVAVEINGKNKCNDLTDNRCDCGSANAHFEHKDKYGVKNNIDYCADALGYHCVKGSARRLQKSFVHYFKENSEAGAAAYLKILCTLVNDVGNCCL